MKRVPCGFHQITRKKVPNMRHYLRQSGRDTDAVLQLPISMFESATTACKLMNIHSTIKKKIILVSLKFCTT